MTYGFGFLALIFFIHEKRLDGSKDPRHVIGLWDVGLVVDRP